MNSSNQPITVLDIGSGSGYVTAASAITAAGQMREPLSSITSNQVRVVGIDHVPELVQFATSAVRSAASVLVDQGCVVFQGWLFFFVYKKTFHSFTNHN